MVTTAANIKTPALPATLEVNGQAMATPSGAVGIVGKLDGNELFVVRNGQTVSLKAGDWLLEGDRVVTTPAAEQSLYFAGDASGSLRRIVFARGADFKIRNGEIYTTSLMTSSMVTAAEALPQGIVAAGSDDTAIDPDAAMAVEETSSISGLFGSPLALGAASVLGVGGGAVALASVVKNDSATPAADPAPNTTPAGNDGTGDGTGGNNGENTDGNTGDAPASGGAFSSGGAQLDGLLADNPTGQTPPFSFADGAAMLEGALPVPLAAPAANSGSPAAALADAATGLIGSLPANPISQALADAGVPATQTASAGAPSPLSALDSITGANTGTGLTNGISTTAINDVVTALPLSI